MMSSASDQRGGIQRKRDVADTAAGEKDNESEDANTCCHKRRRTDEGPVSTVGQHDDHDGGEERAQVAFATSDGAMFVLDVAAVLEREPDFAFVAAARSRCDAAPTFREAITGIVHLQSVSSAAFLPLYVYLQTGSMQGVVTPANVGLTADAADFLGLTRARKVLRRWAKWATAFTLVTQSFVSARQRKLSIYTVVTPANKAGYKFAFGDAALQALRDHAVTTLVLPSPRQRWMVAPCPHGVSLTRHYMAITRGRDCDPEGPDLVQRLLDTLRACLGFPSMEAVVLQWVEHYQGRRNHGFQRHNPYHLALCLQHRRKRWQRLFAYAFYKTVQRHKVIGRIVGAAVACFARAEGRGAGAPDTALLFGSVPRIAAMAFVYHALSEAASNTPPIANAHNVFRALTAAVLRFYGATGLEAETAAHYRDK
jgi:hypothetical protein